MCNHWYQVLDIWTQVNCLLNGIRCDKLFTAINTTRAHPDKYVNDLDEVVTYLSLHTDKQRPILSVNMAFIRLHPSHRLDMPRDTEE